LYADKYDAFDWLLRTKPVPVVITFIQRFNFASKHGMVVNAHNNNARARTKKSA